MSNRILDVGELTRIAIEEQYKSAALCDPAPEKALIAVVRENLHEWESSLFPLLRMQKKSIYDFLVKLLAESGYKNVTASNLCIVVHKVRKERGNRG